MSGDARVIVIGAGVTGLLVAIGCARAGHRVVVLERGEIPDRRATSFDQHRVVRAVDPDDPVATRRTAPVDRRWQEVEALLEVRFYRRVGVLTAWPLTAVERVTATAAAAGLPVETVEPAAFPHLGLPPDTVPVLELAAGVLLAERVLRAAAGWLARHPAVALRPGQQVTGVEPESGRVTLADGGVLEGDLLVVAAGPWSGDLVEVRPVLRRQTMVYLEPPAGLARWWHGVPAAGGLGVGRRGWLVPPGEGTLLKLSSATACRDEDPRAGDRGAGTVTDGEPGSAEDMATATGILSESIINGVERYPVVKVTRCHYTLDRDTGGGRLTRVGPKVWVRAATGGDGFRTAPLVADRIVEEMDRPSGTIAVAGGRERDDQH
jgi:glycine/D-amino acid oxidase-like deaminating enzyme